MPKNRKTGQKNEKKLMARSAKKQEKNKNALEKQQKNTKKTTRHGVPKRE